MIRVVKRQIALRIVWLVCAALLTPALEAGDIVGQLRITRVLTPTRVVLPVYDVRGVASRPAATDGPVDEWTRVAVYLEGAPEEDGEPVTAVLDQRGQRFDPELLVVPVGSTVSFPNSDPIFHNVFSLSDAREFDLGFYPAGETRTVRFETPGIVQVYCHLHPDMNAAIVVAPNRWHAQPDEGGSFVLEGVPAGTYTLVVWHRTAGFFRQEVAIEADGTAAVSLEIPVPTGGVR